MTNFKIGDIVYLKSGSPAMTVTFVGVHKEDNKVACTWFDSSKKYDDTFDVGALTDKNSLAPPMPLKS